MTQLKRVAIIGAGPAGLAAAKALKMEKTAFEVVLFDRKKSIGGAWYYDADLKKYSYPTVPSTDPNGTELYRKTSPSPHIYVSPLYKRMETNLVERLMEFKDLPIESKEGRFKLRSEIMSYLKKYAETIPGAVDLRLNFSVEEVSKNGTEWNIVATDLVNNRTTDEKYDFVIVANGHNELPYIPDVPGLREWSHADPDSITHSKYYDVPDQYKGQNILVVGNFASGADLATQISVVAKNVFVSTTAAPEALPQSKYEQLHYYTQIERYDVETRSAITKSGDIIADIDVIVFCTGYLYSLPFLNKAIPEITNGVYVKDLYRQIFYTQDPTLAFVGLNKFVAPFPLSESQSAVIARVFAGRIKLPDSKFMQNCFESEMAGRGSEKQFHNLVNVDFNYCNSLYEWIVLTETVQDGMLPIFWDKELIDIRQDAADVKAVRFEFVKEHAQTLRERGETFEFPDTWL